MSEIPPTIDNLSDPYVLQLIETIAKMGDEIEQQRQEILSYTDRIDELERCIVVMTSALEELSNEET